MTPAPVPVPVFDLGPMLALVLAGLNIMNILYTWWRTRNQNVETRFTSSSERMDRHDQRLASVEQSLRSLPVKDDLHNLNLTIEGLRGDVRELRAAQTASAAASLRQDTVLGRVEQFLLERSGK